METVASMSPTISNNIISDNIESHALFGGGLALYNGSSAIIHHNLFSGNYATRAVEYIAISMIR
jgi:hypothetical protein